MSDTLIKAALKTAFNNISPYIVTAWGNTKPLNASGAEVEITNGVPYQRVHVLGVTDNPTLGSDHYRVNGYMQIDLCYQQGKGEYAADTRAELIKTTFKRGYSFTSGGVTVVINKTPETMTNGRNEGDRFIKTVKVYFFCNIN